MRKLLTACLMVAGMQMVSAQEATWVPKNLAVGVGVGTTGIVIDASTTIHNYFGVRFGVDIMPKIKVNKDINLKTAAGSLSQLTNEVGMLNTYLSAAGLETIDLSRYPDGNLPNKMDVQGKFSNTTWHFLIDVYPFGAAHGFHATVGAYFGSSQVIDLYNREDGFLQPINAYNNAYLYAQNTADASIKSIVDKYDMIGAEMGDYFVTPNPAQNGNVNAYAKVNSFRPYLGIGFGRAVPKNRIGCQFDLGVQFWGKPDVFVPTYNKATRTYQDEKIDADNAGNDAGKVLKTISKFSVYPVLNFRLVGRIL